MHLIFIYLISRFNGIIRSEINIRVCMRLLKLTTSTEQFAQASCFVCVFCRARAIANARHHRVDIERTT